MLLILWCFVPIVSINSFFVPSKSFSKICQITFSSHTKKSFPTILQMYTLGKKLLPTKIEQCKIAEINSSKFVSRVQLEEKINSIQSKNPTGIYRIVYGSKGSGKTELVDHTAIGKNAVIKLVVTSANSKDDIVSTLSRKILGTDTAGLTPENVVEAVKACKIIPTIIFDVERGGSPDQVMGIQAVRSLAKMLSPFCRCIIVLSETNAVLEFGLDNSREDFIFVDDCSHSEARKIINNWNVQLTEEEIVYLFDTIGTNPAMLIEMSEKISDGITLTDFVIHKLGQARRDLFAFPHKAILKALKDTDQGVSPEYFNNQISKNADLSNPKEVGVAMKNSNAIVYRMELGLYTLMSVAHKTALKNYEF